MSRKWIGFPLLLTVAAAQTPREEPPTFRATTRVVEVDVVARRNGAPATGLTREDFTLLDNGKPQKISFFSVRSNRVSAPAAGPAAAPLPPGAVSNRLERGGEGAGSTTGNTAVLLIDQVHTPTAAQAFAIPRIVKFVRMRRKGDRLGIYTFGANGLQAVQEITDDSELLNRAANRLRARDRSSRDSDTTGMTAHAAADFSALTISAGAAGFQSVLETIARHLARVPGRKSLIWVTNSFPLFFPPPPQPPIVDFRKEMEAGARALNDANVALYAVDARGIMGALDGLTAVQNAEFKGPQTPAQLRQQMQRGEAVSPDGLITEQFLAGLTGGLVFYNKSNAIEESIQTAVDDGELTYTLGFYPAQEDQDGSRHNLKVRVDKPGVSVRCRESYFASKTAAASERPTLETLLKDPLDATQVELVAETSPDAARPGWWQVRVSLDLRDVQLERQNDNWLGAVDVSFMIGGSRTVRTITTKVTIPDKGLAAALEKGIVVNDSIDAGGAAGVLRIVALDPATGAAGSVRVPLGKR